MALIEKRTDRIERNEQAIRDANDFITVYRERVHYDSMCKMINALIERIRRQEADIHFLFFQQIANKSKHYYAYADNQDGDLEQLLVSYDPPVGLNPYWLIPSTNKNQNQVWTGIIYKTVKEANDDMVKLNCI